MKKVTVLINSMTDGGAEMVLSRISKGIFFDKIILLENVRKFELNNQNCETLRENYRSKGGKFFSLFRDCFRLNVKNSICFSLLKRSNLINVLSKIISNHTAIISEHSVPAKDGSKLFKWISRRVISVVYNKANLLIVPSQGVRQILINDFKIKIPVKVIPNPIDIDLISESKIADLDNDREIEIFRNRVYLCVGRFNHVKNHKNTIEIFKQYLTATSDVSSHLVFLGEGELLNECLSYTKELKIEERVHFLGFKNNVYKYMSKSHAMLLNSKWESFGNVIIEAFACDCPVISTDIPVGPGEIFRDRVTPIWKDVNFEEYDYGLLVAPQNEKAFINALKLASDDKSWIIKNELANKVALKYSLAKICEEYKKLFLEYGG